MGTEAADVVRLISNGDCGRNQKDVKNFPIERRRLALDDCKRCMRRCHSNPAASARGRFAKVAVVAAAAAGDAPVYGVNTGFGKLANQRIGAADLDTLQLNLIRSHSVGVGEPLAPAVVRLMLALKAASLARGYSGVREVVVDTLLAVYNAGLIPCALCLSRGSVGASGDLAPLSHMTLGAARRRAKCSKDGRRCGGRRAGKGRNRAAAPGAKEGLALINGADLDRSGAARALSFEPVLESALVIGALTVDAARARQRGRSIRAFTRCVASQGRSMSRVTTALLAGSEIPPFARENDDRVQDPYCLRCQPQVVGACLDQLRHAALVLLRGPTR